LEIDMLLRLLRHFAQVAPVPNRGWAMAVVGVFAGLLCATSAAAEPIPTPAPTWASPTLGTFRLIPAGTFTMGCKARRDDVAGRCYSDDTPHSVTLTQPYYLMEHEVTQGEWQAVMGSNPSWYKSCGSRCPVELVSWYDAQTFIAKVSARDGVTYRLPTEAEWERAARGGQEFAYAGSNEVGAVGWYGDFMRGETHPVCGKSRNGYGLCDMTGNVWEWVGDWWGEYGSASATDPRGPSAGSFRVRRGGGWINDEWDARVAYRNCNDPAYRNSYLGFRLLRSVPDSSTGVASPTPPTPTSTSTDSTWASPTLGTFRLIPAGTFTMGCKPGRDDVAGGCYSDESPAHSVTLTKAYYLMEHEVTQGEWQAVMGSNPSDFTRCGSRCPVENVSWDDAQAFIAKVSARDGVTYRLPTEAEWERAARGGQEFAYAGSSDVGAVAWYGFYDRSGNSAETTHPVCGKSRNGYGLCDMSGNVWEWVGDWLGDYGSASATDPRGPSAGSLRVYRGGSWLSTESFVRVAIRDGDGPADRISFLGFRLLRSVP
jgi:formylglycine-generating enzyme required for sulfatase activity